MSISIRPKGEVKIEGQQGDDQSFEYWVTGDNDYATVLLYCEVVLDQWFNFKYRKGVSIAQQAPYIYIATATYAQLKPDDPKYADETGQAPIQFELAGEQQHLTQSLETVTAKGRTGADPVPDYKQAVNVTGSGKDRKVEGYDANFPKFTWSEKYYIPIDTALSIAYRNVLRDCYDHVNKKKFRGHKVHEVIFLGCTGGMSEKYPDYCELTYRFEAGKNVTGLSFGEITGVDKEAFDLLWVQYEFTEDNTAHVLTQRPRYVFVERIKDEFDFDKLQLPVIS